MSTGVAEGVARIAPVAPAGSRLGGARLASYAVAGLVHLGTLAVVAAAVLAGISAIHHAWLFAIVAFLLAIAWLMRPRLGGVPAEGVLTRGEAPTLYGLCDDVAQAYGCRTVSYVVVDSGFGARSSAIGWRRRRTIGLGLPLVAALPPQARVALVASQLAPEKTRGSQGLFIRSAMGALDEWRALLAPQEMRSNWSRGTYRSAEGGLAAASAPVANAIVWVLGRPAVWLLRLETRLVSCDSEVSAYRADLQAAEVAGKRAMVDLYEHLRLRRRFPGIVRQEARAGRDGLLSRVTAAVDAIPAEVRGGGPQSEERLPPGQPSTAARVQLLEQRASTTAKVVLDSSRSAAIDRELELRALSVEGDLYEWYRASIYR